MIDVVIVGAGASGMVAGILLAEKNYRVTIIEEKTKVGRKLLATGNGRCNISNGKISKKKYMTKSKNIFPTIYRHFDLKKTLDFFKSIGIITRELSDHKLYPFSLQALSVVNALELKLKSLGVEIITDASVVDVNVKDEFIIKYVSAKDIEAYKNIFLEGKIKDEEVCDLMQKDKGLEYKTVKSRFLVLATGGISSPRLSMGKMGYMLAKKLGHLILEPEPSIVQLRMKKKELDYRYLQGSKQEASLSLVDNEGKLIRREVGELLFTQYGLSGPPILQLSRNYAREKSIHKDKKFYLKIDLMTEMTKDKLRNTLYDLSRLASQLSVKELLSMLLPYKISIAILKANKINMDIPFLKLKNQEINSLIDYIKGMKLEIISNNGFENAQVTHGGISCKEVNENTLESLLVKDLYFCGEILDIDGDCGGYNLQWAWSSGGLVAESIIKKGG